MSEKVELLKSLLYSKAVLIAQEKGWVAYLAEDPEVILLTESD